MAGLLAVPASLVKLAWVSDAVFWIATTALAALGLASLAAQVTVWVRYARAGRPIAGRVARITAAYWSVASAVLIGSWLIQFDDPQPLIRDLAWFWSISIAFGGIIVACISVVTKLGARVHPSRERGTASQVLDADRSP